MTGIESERRPLSPMQLQLQRAARDWQGRIELPDGVRPSTNAKLNAMVVALDTIGRTTVQKFLNPRRDKNDSYMPDGDKLIRFCSVADISLDWLVSGRGTMRLSLRKENATAHGLAQFIKEGLLDEAEKEVERAEPGTERLEAKVRRGFIESACRFNGESALELLLEIARADVESLREFEAIFAVGAYARTLRGQKAGETVRGVAANMGRRAAQLMRTIPPETQLVELAAGPEGAPRVKPRVHQAHSHPTGSIAQ